MSDRAQLLEQLVGDEAFVAHLYICPSGKLSLGIGRNLEANPLTAAEWRALYDAGELAVSISRAGAERLAKSAIGALEVRCAATFKFWRALNDARQNVLINMAFNMGLEGVCGFRDFLACLNTGDYEGAAREMYDSLWARQVGDGPGGKWDRVDRLAQQMRDGKFPATPNVGSAT